MASRFVDPIPECFQPDEKENVVSTNVIRGVHSNQIVVENFLPTYIEHPRNPRAFIEEDQEYYSMSVYRSLEECKAALMRYKRTWNSIIGFAEGDTNLERGIAKQPEKDGHIGYYLYDYANNNPCQDFHYLCDK